MTRLVIFLSFIAVTAAVLGLNSYKSIKPDNSFFDFDEKEKAYKDKLVSIKATKAPKMAKKIEKIEMQVIEVVLATETEKKGYDTYTKGGKCITCHGKMGEGKKSQQAPRLAGQHAWYTEAQLINMKKGLRVNAKMNPYLRPLNETDFKEIAVFLAKLPPQPLDDNTEVKIIIQ